MESFSTKIRDCMTEIDSCFEKKRMSLPQELKTLIDCLRSLIDIQTKENSKDVVFNEVFDWCENKKEIISSCMDRTLKNGQYKIYRDWIVIFQKVNECMGTCKICNPLYKSIFATLNLAHVVGINVNRNYLNTLFNGDVTSYPGFIKNIGNSNNIGSYKRLNIFIKNSIDTYELIV